MANKKIQDAAYETLLDAATAYLQAQGIKPAVIGGAGYRHHWDEHTDSHELVVRFVAKINYEDTQPPSVKGGMR